ncbi:MAG: hypothetical protein AB7K68_00165 [Bacteriovoracia bacterium]
MTKVGVGLLLIVSSLAFATTGEVPVMSLKDSLEKSDNIFVGKVKQVERLPSVNGNGADTRVEFEVVRSFKGEKNNQRFAYFHSKRNGNKKDAPSSIENVGSFLIMFLMNSSGNLANVESGSFGILPYPDRIKGESSYIRCRISAIEAYSQGKSMDEVLEIAQCSKKKKRP